MLWFQPSGVNLRMRGGGDKQSPDNVLMLLLHGMDYLILAQQEAPHGDGMVKCHSLCDAAPEDAACFSFP